MIPCERAHISATIRTLQAGSFQSSSKTIVCSSVVASIRTTSSRSLTTRILARASIAPLGFLLPMLGLDSVIAAQGIHPLVEGLLAGALMPDSSLFGRQAGDLSLSQE